MKIKVGKYTINSNKWSWWVEEEYEVSKGKTKGSIQTRNVTGFCTSFEKCRNSFAERRIGEDGATNLLELLDALNRVFEDMKALNEAKLNADMNKLKEISK